MTTRPIRTEEDYEAACRRIDEIFQADPDSPEGEELEILATLVDAYEEEHFPIGEPHPIEVIEIQMHNLGVSRKDLGQWLGKSTGGISDLLNCRRRMTLNAIRILSQKLRIPVELLSRDYPIQQDTPPRLRPGRGRSVTAP
jgi:HTH-type transcriptional regulator / antitoxin HigA